MFKLFLVLSNIILSIILMFAFIYLGGSIYDKRVILVYFLAPGILSIGFKLKERISWIDAALIYIVGFFSLFIFTAFLAGPK